jgi:MYXO-CTERM domain-containing protein
MARIDRNGSLIANKLPIWGPGGLVNPASESLGVAWSGSSFLIARASGGPKAQLISSDGKQVGTPFPITSASQSTKEPAVASDGTNFLVVWDDNDRGSGGIRGVRISPTGQILDSSPLLLSSLKNVLTLHLTWVGTEYILDFQNTVASPAATQLLRISSSGVPLDAKPVITSVFPQRQTRIAATSDRLLLIDSGIQAPEGSWLKMDGTASGEPAIPLCAAANRQTWPTVVWNGSVYLAVWYDDRTIKNPQVRGQILDATGRPLLADSFLITQASDLATEPYEVDGPGGRLGVASDGKDFFVAWSLTYASESQVRAARVSAAGKVLDSDGIDLANGYGQKNPAVVWTGANYFVTYLMYASGRNSGYVVGGKVIDNKGVITDGQDLRLGTGDNTDPCQRFAAVWGQDLLIIAENGYGPLTLTRFDGTGKLLGKRTLLGSVVDVSQIHPSAAWNGKEYLVACSQYTPGEQTPALAAARLGSDGTMLDNALLQVSKSGVLHDGASVAWDGNNFVIAWFDRSDPIGSDDHWSAFMARVDASGTVLDPGGIRISNPDEYGAHPTVASRGGGDGLLALQRYDSSADMRAIRVVTRAFSDKAPAEKGTACVDAVACQSGFCVDGVCCDSACGGGNTADCQACSLAAGAKVNGTCGPLAAGVVCRASAGSCDRAELCDGVGLICPADLGVDGGCGIPEPARDAGFLAPDAGVADIPSAQTPDASVPDSLPRDASADSSRDVAAAPETGPDLTIDSPVDRLITDASVVADLALPLDARAPDAPAASSSKSGCSCHIGGRADDHDGVVFVLLMAAGLIAGRRRRS